MQRMVVLFLCACMTAFSFAASAEHALRADGEGGAPMRIALVPIIDRTGGWISAREMDELLERLEREIHVPLNETMHWIEYVPYDEAERAFRFAARDTKKKDAAAYAVREAAAELFADLVICLTVDRHYQYECMSVDRDREPVIESMAEVTLYVYDKKTDRVIKKRASRWERDTYSPMYDVQALTMDALEEAIRETELRSCVFPISKDRRERVFQAGESKR